MYSYDRRAATLHPEVAFRVEGDWAIVSVLVGSLLGAFRRKVETPEAIEGELVSLKGRLESLSGTEVDALFDKAQDILDAEGWRFSTDFKDRDPELARRQGTRKKEQQKADAKVLGQWLRGGVVKLVEDIYRRYKAGHYRQEPCVTAGYVREVISEVPGWNNHRDAFRALSPKQQLAACHYALESARKKGQLGSSTGLSMGRETRCYEPAS